MAPNLHWPDTMFTYDRATSILYTCDAFGMHYCSEEVSLSDYPSDDSKFSGMALEAGCVAEMVLASVARTIGVALEIFSLETWKGRQDCSACQELFGLCIDLTFLQPFHRTPSCRNHSDGTDMFHVYNKQGCTVIRILLYAGLHQLHANAEDDPLRLVPQFSPLIKPPLVRRQPTLTPLKSSCKNMSLSSFCRCLTRSCPSWSPTSGSTTTASCGQTPAASSRRSASWATSSLAPSPRGTAPFSATTCPSLRGTMSSGASRRWRSRARLWLCCTLQTMGTATD
jgi:hypothetical protein